MDEANVISFNRKEAKTISAALSVIIHWSRAGIMSGKAIKEMEAVVNKIEQANTKGVS